MHFLTLTSLELEALRLSLWVSSWAVLGSLPLGILAAWALARLRFPGKNLLDGLIHLPLVLPPRRDRISLTGFSGLQRSHWCVAP